MEITWQSLNSKSKHHIFILITQVHLMSSVRQKIYSRIESGSQLLIKSNKYKSSYWYFCNYIFAKTLNRFNVHVDWAFFPSVAISLYIYLPSNSGAKKIKNLSTKQNYINTLSLNCKVIFYKVTVFHYKLTIDLNSQLNLQQVKWTIINHTREPSLYII